MQFEFTRIERSRTDRDRRLRERAGGITTKVEFEYREGGEDDITGGDENLLEYMISSDGSDYDSRIASFLAAASAWAYADTDTFTRLLCGRRLSGQCVALTLTNEALLVDTTAYVFQSSDKSLVIIAFRGTEPTNILSWLMDASAKTEPLLSAGQVHGGFYRSALVLWPMLRHFLIAASECKEIKSVYDAITGEDGPCAPETSSSVEGCGAGTEGSGPQPGAEGTGPRPGESAKGLQAVYICGHSLGGALAILTAAGIHMDLRRRAMDPIKRVLRGIYTYGAPMVCDAVSAKALDEKFGNKLYRHIYQRDIVPRLPPRTVGKFVPFGREYVSTEHGWMYQPTFVGQVRFMGWSTLVGTLAWLKSQLPFVRWIPLPMSWADHSPGHYLRTSQKSYAGIELML